ncbi:hypothetical protein [Kribbella caucasensis]|uniref:hypothetical protein n=1 Tax=Kribbella caucasensis TaxID=2512215 RepID=UPI00105C2037|nr:hypothetical protein [Kribbella sp. VKM Ac-2527]
MARGRPARRWQSSAYAGTSSTDGRAPTDSARSSASAPAGCARTSSTVVDARRQGEGFDDVLALAPDPQW